MPAQYVNTLRYWFDVEALMYPDLPKPGKRPVFFKRYDEQLPWLPAPRGTLAADAAHGRHTYFVWFGLVEKGVLEAELAQMFPPDAAEEKFSGNHLRPARGNTFLCAIEIGSDGRPSVDTLQLAAFAVAFAEKKNQTRIGYGTTLFGLKNKLHELAMGNHGIADADWFDQVTDFLIGELDWKPRTLLARAQLCAHEVALVDRRGKKFPRAPEMDPVNSFYLDDLERMRQDAEHGPGSAQIQAYLDGHERSDARRSDARRDITRPGTVNAALDPRRFPVGRWPTEFPLFLMQQVAVNIGLETLADGGIFSVNGPPGTGKTTLLMDIIAARVVERARILVQFANPESAFARAPHQVEYPANSNGVAYRGPCFHLDERLLDSGIVVASENNKAVENITLDLPSIKKVAPQALLVDGAPFDYFAASAESILNEEKKKLPCEAEETGADAPADDDADDDHGKIRCWGLISVPLGKKANRSLVANRLGAFHESGLAKQLAAAGASLNWEAARTRFNEAVAAVEAMQAAILDYDLALPEWKAARELSAAADAAAAAARQRNDESSAALAALDADNAANASAIATNLRERELHATEWPGWRQLLARLFRKAAFAGFQARRQALSDEYDSLRGTRARLAVARLERSTSAATYAGNWQAARADAATRAAALRTVRQRLDALAASLGEAAFDPAAFAELPVEQQQKSLPRSNAGYHAARATVFVAAMQLHKAFLKHAGKPFETNFRLALAMLAQDGYIQPHLAAMARHLWATFFLAVPVVSSTFASVSRCFADLGEGDIGLLLVDEAGQAVPSHALGAIWRSKRALIVGDPLQVEPVIAMDKKLDYGILSYHQAPAGHQLTAYSAQHLADRGNRFGANVVQYDGSDLWVGAPLRVHRRCADPMFSLSNRIAYNGKMVYGPARAEEQQASVLRPLLGPSCWHDAAGGEFEEHYNAREGALAADIVVRYASNGWVGKAHGLPDLFLISPFKSVAQELTSLLRERVDEWAGEADDDAIAKWLHGHVGTVHTFQGKECETVVFVLGGKSDGARNWAAGRPNIINVAATRAKRRLYVIGNRQQWSRTLFGRQLADAVPVLSQPGSDL
ncbi:AAA domain-containing protein [Massilia sp. P8910]|uniref:DEAD/DEAH box helicase n=1 Tax=Massilia antarctica TaxID=2765360 RepID=UPI001E317C85|nr:AAA domain-containing protein [Massilia antarctica]MCE3605777.1 AAA domain-containing protein [Massilia antarctica]